MPSSIAISVFICGIGASGFSTSVQLGLVVKTRRATLVMAPPTPFLLLMAQRLNHILHALDKQEKQVPKGFMIAYTQPPIQRKDSIPPTNSAIPEK